MKALILAAAVSAAAMLPASAQNTTNTGVTAVQSQSMQVTFVTPTDADFMTSSLIGSDVYNLQNEDIGEVEDIVIRDGKTVSGIVVSVGGFLGIGDRYVVIDPNTLTLSLTGEGDDREWKVVADTTKETLEKAPAFKYEGKWDR